MPQFTAYCQQSAMSAVLSKMKARLPLLGRSHPYFGTEDNELESLFWEIVKKHLQEYCAEEKKPFSINDYGFVFGAPLNDTVFMCTPGLSSSKCRATFEVSYLPGGSAEAMVDFYSLVE